MNKYGVDESPSEGQKQAQSSEPKVCPICKQPLTLEGRIRLCPTHGSEPFEVSNVRRT